MKMNRTLVAWSLALAAGGAFAADGTWNYEAQEGLTPTDPADWSDSRNWVDETLPSGQDAAAWLVAATQTASMADVTRYIRVPDAGLTLGGLSTRRGVKLYVTGGPIALTNNAPTMGQSSKAALRDETAGASYCDAIYFNEMIFEDVYINRCALAGVLRPQKSSSLITVADSLRLVPYRQAASDATTITDPSWNGNITVGSNLIGYYPPTGADAATGTWKVTADSRLLERVGSAHPLAAGQRVSGSGIPVGAFVSRIYTPSLIEISVPASASSESDEGTELSFEVFSPSVRQSIGALKLIGSAHVTLALMKLRETDDVVYVVDSLTTIADQTYEVALDIASSHFNVLPDAKVYPAQVVFKSVSSAKNPLRLVDANVVFDDGASVTTTVARVTIGSAKCHNSATRTSGAAAVLVGDGKVTRWSSLEEFNGTLAKTGSGELAVTVQTNCTALGSVTVSGGRLSLDGDAASRTLSALNVAAGATFAVGGGMTLSADSVSFASGASLHVAAGATLFLTLAEGASLEGVTTTGEGKVTLLYGTDIKALDSGAPLESSEQVAPGIKGTPAFWVTAESLAAASPAGTLEEVGGKTEILRWNDCRGAAEGGPMFATNRVNRPYLVTSGNYPYVKFPTGSNTKETNYGLVWNAPLKNIRAVFTVIDTTDGFGSILGSSSRLSTFNFARGSRGASNGLFYDSGSGYYGSAFIANPRSACFINGKELPKHTTGVYAAMGDTYGMAVIEVETTGNCEADAFASAAESGNWAGRWDLVGGERLYELIVYTNALSYVDRYNIHAYLMKKYGMPLPACADGEIFHNDKRTRVKEFAPPAGTVGRVAVEANCTATLPAVTNGVLLEKTGAGTLYVSDARTAGTLSVQSGTLVVRSADVTADLLPEGAVVRFDASDLTSLTYAWDATRGLNTLTKWKDLAAGIEATLKQSSHTNLPFVVANALNGKSVVDFGPALADISSHAKANSCLTFTPQYDLKTVFTVHGSAGGGGTLLGGTAGRQDSYSSRLSNKTTHGIWRNIQSYPGDLTRPLIESDGATVNNDYKSLQNLQVRMNGAVVDQTKATFSGAYDLFTLSANMYSSVSTNLESSALGAVHYANSGGGMQLAETIFYKRHFNQLEIEEVEAYLTDKWFDARRPGYAQATAEKVDVASGATLRVTGGKPLTVKTLSGAGTIDGSVTLAATSALMATVSASGTVVPTVVSGSVDLSAGGTVVLAGQTEKLVAGTYEILRAGTTLTGDLANWQIDASAVHRPRRYSLAVSGTSLSLTVENQGLFFLVR